MADNQNIEVKLTNVRLSFAHLFTAQKPKGDANAKPKFNCAFLIPKETSAGKKIIESVKDAMRQAREAKWGKNPPKLKADKMCLRDGDQEDYDGYEGMMYVAASNSRRPTVIDRDRSPLTEEDGKPYSGCYVNAIIRIWCQDNEFGKRINASLEGVQFVKDGEAFGAAPLDADSFDDLGSDDDDDLGSEGDDLL